jgi:hypothetical protein
MRIENSRLLRPIGGSCAHSVDFTPEFAVVCKARAKALIYERQVEMGIIYRLNVDIPRSPAALPVDPTGFRRVAGGRDFTRHPGTANLLAEPRLTVGGETGEYRERISGLTVNICKGKAIREIDVAFRDPIMCLDFY